MHIIMHMPRYGNSPTFFWMFVLTMAAFSIYQIPSISLQSPDEISNFHAGGHLIFRLIWLYHITI